MSEWKETTLAEIAEIEMGQSPTGETCNASGDGMPLLNGPTEFGIKNPIAVQYTTDSKRECRPFDILFCVRGSTTGKMNWADRKYSIGRGLAAIRHKSGVEYRYFLQGIIDYNLELLLSSATGSTFPNVTRSQIEGVEIKLPSLPEQKSIASILSSLDDKIDLLHRQNATLEKMAETLFRQWFVEEAKEDWEEIELGSVVETTSGGTPSRTNMEFYENGTISWVKSKELNGSFILDTEEKITEEALKKSSAKILPAHSVLIAMYGATVGEYAIISKEMTCNQAICALKPNKDYPYSYLFLFIKSNKEELINMAVGSAQQNISQLLIKQLPVLNCTDLIKEFNLVVEPYFEKIKTNQTQIRTLTALRDTLLPKLMSGEVKVEM
jgi:type I restriction enzyme S subunit